MIGIKQVYRVTWRHAGRPELWAKVVGREALVLKLKVIVDYRSPLEKLVVEKQ